MPSKSTRNFKVTTKVGAIDLNKVKVSPGAKDKHEVVVRLLSGTPAKAELFCVKSSGTAADYHPAPPDSWDYDFGSIDVSTPVGRRTAAREIHAGSTPGIVTLQVKELHVDDGGPGVPLVHPVFLDVEVTVG